MAYEQEKFISHSSAVWKSKIGCQHGWVAVKAVFGVADFRLLTMSSHGGKGLCYKGTDVIHEGSTLMINSTPKGPTC